MKTTGILPRAYGRSRDRPVGSYRRRSAIATTGRARASAGPCAREDRDGASATTRIEVTEEAIGLLTAASPQRGARPRDLAGRRRPDHHEYPAPGGARRSRAARDSRI